MADDTKTTEKGSESSADDQFKNFPPIPKGHVRVFLNRSFSPGREPLKGPGWAHVPESWLPILEKQPELTATDATGAPLPTSTAASAAGFAGTVAGGAAIPIPERDEDGELTDPDAGEPTSAFASHRAAVAAAAESGERTGGEHLIDTGSHLDTARTLTAQPGFRGDASTGRSSDSAAAKPATKTALRDVPVDELRTLAQRKGVRVSDDATKDEIVDTLYDARVSLD
jgi:hypothetical protein